MDKTPIQELIEMFNYYGIVETWTAKDIIMALEGKLPTEREFAEKIYSEGVDSVSVTNGETSIDYHFDNLFKSYEDGE